MPAVTNTFTTAAAQANREDLSSVIFNIDPADTPFISAVGRRNVSNRIFDWQTENLPVVSTTAKAEGFELSRSAATPTVRQSNIVQIMSRDATVSGSQEAANAAGKRSEMAHQLALIGKALRRDLEAALVSEQGKNDGSSNGGIRYTRALESWLETNANRANDGDDAPSAEDTPVDGTARALTENLVKNAMQQCYISGAEPSIMMIGPVNKLQVSTFVGRAGTTVNVSPNTVSSAVSIFATDFGDLKVVVNRHQRERTAFLLDPEYAAVAFYRNFATTDIAKIGDADTKMLVVEAGLEMKNEAAHGVIADLYDTNAAYEAAATA